MGTPEPFQDPGYTQGRFRHLRSDIRSRGSAHPNSLDIGLAEDGSRNHPPQSVVRRQISLRIGRAGSTFHTSGGNKIPGIMGESAAGKKAVQKL